MAARGLLLIPSLLAFALLGGCAQVEYAWQGVRGQLELWRLARPIPEVLAASETAPPLRTRLVRVLEMREFAARELALPDNGSYRSYADLGRPYVVWNVIATPELSLEPEQWCFPVAGCVAYHGYFDRAEALAEAQRLRGRGLDVHVGGVPAYSTLGWFDDPVLNTFVQAPEVEVARLIFHELAHQVVYLPGDTMFNESFATAVEEEGIARWLAGHAAPGERETWERVQGVRSGFRALVGGYRAEFAALYASAASPPDKRAGKARILAAMAVDYGAFKARWGGYRGYDAWFAQGPNNASLAAVGLYSELVPAFRGLFARVDGDFPAFYAEVRRLAQMPREARETALRASSP